MECEWNACWTWSILECFLVRIMLQGRTVAAPAPRVNLDQTVSTTVIVTTVIFFTFFFFFQNHNRNIHYIFIIYTFTFLAGALCNPVDGKCKCKPGSHLHDHNHYDHNHIIFILFIISSLSGYAGARCEDLCPEGYFGQDCYQVHNDHLNQDYYQVS